MPLTKTKKDNIMKKIKLIKKHIKDKSDKILHYCKQSITFVSKIPHFISITFFSNKHKTMPNTHKNTTFTRNQEVKKIGSFVNNEIILGKANGKYLFLNKSKHNVFAQTKTSKTTAIPMMKLLICEKSYIVNDIKLQLFSTTSKYRQQISNKVFLWNPDSQKGLSHRYNPLNAIEDSCTIC